MGHVHHALLQETAGHHAISRGGPKPIGTAAQGPQRGIGRQSHATRTCGGQKRGGTVLGTARQNIKISSVMSIKYSRKYIHSRMCICNKIKGHNNLSHLNE